MAKTIFEKSSEGRRGYTFPKNSVTHISLNDCIPANFRRNDTPRLPEVSELDVMRHFVELGSMNHFIEKGFYPLGSCTMKYNPKSHETFVRNPGFSSLHPNQPVETVQGALRIMFELQNDLSEIAGFSQVSLQPVAGAHGEFTGLKIMKAYHDANGNSHKNKIIFPDSAHGTNPASVTLNGYKPVEIKSNSKGMVDLDALKAAVDDDCAGFMLTNPNTLGIFENQIEEISEIIHNAGGLMYMDGANLNALLGIVKPGEIGFDVMHYNLHKTFSTPHGGGGPGSGPVGVREDLIKFLPAPLVAYDGKKYFFDNDENSIGKVHSFYGNFAVNLRAFIYIKMLGSKGMLRISENAILNANYIMRKIEKHFYVPYNEHCMHEFVASSKWQKEENGVKTIDVAKRLLDYGFHAPTIYFPLIVTEAMMIEPTETESKETLDEFIEVMIKISDEAKGNPEALFEAPTKTPVRRTDDARAVKSLDVSFYK